MINFLFPVLFSFSSFSWVNTQNEQLPIFKPKEAIWECEEEEYEEHLDACSWYCAAPEIIVSASSGLKPYGEISYVATHAHDFDLNTAWVEGANNYGEGEYIVFEFQMKERSDDKLAITGFSIANGYHKTRKLWLENSRAKKLKMYVDNKPYAIIELLDVRGFQKIEFGSIKLEPKKNKFLKFEILEVYKGDKYSDTVITEVEFDGIGDH
jgi:hypothetical protein